MHFIRIPQAHRLCEVYALYLVPHITEPYIVSATLAIDSVIHISRLWFLITSDILFVPRVTLAYFTTLPLPYVVVLFTCCK